MEIAKKGWSELVSASLNNALCAQDHLHPPSTAPSYLLLADHTPSALHSEDGAKLPFHGLLDICLRTFNFPFLVFFWPKSKL